MRDEIEGGSEGKKRSEGRIRRRWKGKEGTSFPPLPSKKKEQNNQINEQARKAQCVPKLREDAQTKENTKQQRKVARNPGRNAAARQDAEKNARRRSRLIRKNSEENTNKKKIRGHETRGGRGNGRAKDEGGRICGQKSDGGTDKKKGQAWRDGVSGRSSPIEELGMESVPYPINKRASTQIVMGRIGGGSDVKKERRNERKGRMGKKARRRRERMSACEPTWRGHPKKEHKSEQAHREPRPKIEKRKKRVSVLITIAWRRQRKAKGRASRNATKVRKEWMGKEADDQVRGSTEEARLAANPHPSELPKK
ncbi:hypothetical protein C8J57DRAFT_1601187 [Mycena rebaudengoi]|nr:hypothetical protein C8J57DRAFT_1601187 [Mycena rebaudengoi]